MYENLRSLYDGPAKVAKVSFIDTLKAWMLQNNVPQRVVADMTSYSVVSVSEFIRMPDTTPENFIRCVSMAIPELAGEYIRFRLAADEAFFSSAGQQAENRDLYERLKSRSELVVAVETSCKEIVEIMTRLKIQVSK